MAITDKTAIQNYTLTVISESFDNQLTEWITGVEQFINGQCDRTILAESSDSTCTYDGNDKQILLIPDYVSITSVTIDTTDVTTEVYQYPLNKVPKWRLETDAVFYKGRQNITIVGKKGYCTQANLPLDLKWAATVLVAGIVSHANPAKGDVKSESLGRYSVTYKDDTEWTDYKKALEIIKNYRRMR